MLSHRKLFAFFAVPIVFAIAAFRFNAASSSQDLLLCVYHQRFHVAAIQAMATDPVAQTSYTYSSLMESLGDNRNLRRQALPAETKSAFAEITNGFVLTDACTMHQAKTMASKLASYKFKNVEWRFVLNNATSQRGKKNVEGQLAVPFVIF